jgi:hypothetical protein
MTFTLDLSGKYSESPMSHVCIKQGVIVHVCSMCYLVIVRSFHDAHATNACKAARVCLPPSSHILAAEPRD